MSIGIATIILVFFVVWWIVFLAMLPIGVRSQHEDRTTMVEGTEPGAPQKPMLLKKIIWTTVVALFLTTLYVLVAESGLIDPRQVGQNL